jgi:hypothetical protein
MDDREIELLNATYPALPREYFSFLEEIGFGDLGAIHMYGGPVEAPEIYLGAPGARDNILLFGDDGQGYAFGFDGKSGHRIVEVTPDCTIESTYSDDFRSFMTALFAD